uniref:Butyrophilin subfamily 3 member A2-like Ig-C domain-containing protein n=1 Tax=Xiphophorus couchianus TaxID=32473 RepID=A0A3B5M2J2_9TELE
MHFLSATSPLCLGFGWITVGKLTVQTAITMKENNITLLYRDGCETFGMKNPAFHYRTNLLLNKLKDGNISQIIYNLRVSDGGKYNFNPSDVELCVDLVQNVVPSTEGGELTLECKAECWFPEPDITFYDDERNEIPAEKPTRGPNSRECFTVTRRAVVQTKINSHLHHAVVYLSNYIFNNVQTP